MQEDDTTLRGILQSLDVAIKVQINRLGVIVWVGYRSQADVADDGIVVGWRLRECQRLVD